MPILAEIAPERKTRPLLDCNPDTRRFKKYKGRVAKAETLIINIYGPVGTVGFAELCEAICPSKRLSIATVEAIIRLIDEEVLQVRLDEDDDLLARVMHGGRRGAS